MASALLTRITAGCVTVATLTSCGSPSAAHVPITIPATTHTAAPAPIPVIEPVSIDIPPIGVHSSLIPLGLNPDGTLQTPDVHTPGQAGWYSKGVHPGQVGRAIVVGHVDGAGSRGVFYQLHSLTTGAVIEIGLTNGTSLTFRVVSVETDPKNAFPTTRVYGDVNHPALALITCGGVFDKTHRNYLSNVIVFADLVT